MGFAGALPILPRVAVLKSRAGFNIPPAKSTLSEGGQLAIDNSRIANAIRRMRSAVASFV